jgi:hypothetical protein
MMTTDQAVRLQCLELAVKAGTPWSRLTEMADKLTAYVKGVSTAPAVEVQNTSMFAALSEQGLAEIKRTGKMPTTTAIDDEPPLRINLRTCPGCGASDGQLHANDCTRNRDITSWKSDPTAGSMTVDPDHGVAVEDESFDSQAERVAAAMQEHERDWPHDMTEDEMHRREMLLREAPGLAIGSVADKGTPVEETYDAVTGQADYPVASPYGEQPKIEPAGAASDPRLPVVTM